MFIYHNVDQGGKDMFLKKNECSLFKVDSSSSKDVLCQVLMRFCGRLLDFVSVRLLFPYLNLEKRVALPLNVWLKLVHWFFACELRPVSRINVKKYTFMTLIFCRLCIH